MQPQVAYGVHAWKPHRKNIRLRCFWEMKLISTKCVVGPSVIGFNEWTRIHGLHELVGYETTIKRISFGQIRTQNVFIWPKIYLNKSDGGVSAYELGYVEPVDNTCDYQILDIKWLCGLSVACIAFDYRQSRSCCTCRERMVIRWRFGSERRIWWAKQRRILCWCTSIRLLPSPRTSGYHGTVAGSSPCITLSTCSTWSEHHYSHYCWFPVMLIIIIITIVHDLAILIWKYTSQSAS